MMQLQQQMQMMRQMQQTGAAQGGAALGMGGGPPAPVADPSAAYAAQLQALTDMGFPDRDANLRALVATGGNLEAAIARLVS